MSAPVRYIRDLGAPAGLSVAVHELLAALPNAGDSLAAILDNLRRDPTPDRCDLAVIRLTGVQTLVRRISAELLREVPPTV